MKKLFLLLVLGYMLAQNISGQSVAINTTGNPAHPSALLDVSINNKGVMIPRMTLSERNAIPSPGNSLLVFVTDSVMRGYHYYDSISVNWVRIGDQINNNADSCISFIPQPAFPVEYVSYVSVFSNTTMYVGQIIIPFDINASKITVLRNSIGSAGKIKLGFSNENGEKIFEVVTDTISLLIGQAVTTSFSEIKIKSGIYYIDVVPIDNASIDLSSYYTPNQIQYLMNPLYNGNVLCGSLTVPTNTIPQNFNPTSITYGNGRCLTIRIN